MVMLGGTTVFGEPGLCWERLPFSESVSSSGKSCQTFRAEQCHRPGTKQAFCYKQEKVWVFWETRKSAQLSDSVQGT